MAFQNLHSILNECCNINRDLIVEKFLERDVLNQAFGAKLVLILKSSLFPTISPFTSGISANWFEFILIDPNNFS